MYPRLDFTGMPPDTTPVFRHDALRAVVGLAVATAIAALSAQPPEHVHQASTHGFEHTVVHRHLDHSHPRPSASLEQGDHHHASVWLHTFFTHVSKRSLDRPPIESAFDLVLPVWTFQGHVASADPRPIRGAPRSASVPRAPPSSLPLAL